MPIAILHQSYGRFGGAERVALAHYLQLRRMNVDASLFYGGILTDGWATRLNGYQIKSIPRTIPQTRGQLQPIFQLLRELSRYDRIIIHHHVDPILAFYLAKTLGKRTVWYSGSMFELAWERWITGADYRTISTTVHRTGEEYYGAGLSSFLLSNSLFNHTARLARILDIHSARRYTKIIANSSFLSKFLKRIYRLKTLPPVVYPGPDPILEQLSTKDYPREEEFMLAVGPLIPLKNAEGIIRAASRVPSAKLVIVGDGQDRRDLQVVAQDLGVSLHLKGNSHSEEELAYVYAQCGFLVHLSLYEPFGLTPVEAGLFSKPSIVTNRGGPPEIVVDDETGFVVSPRDYKSIAARMNELLTNRELRREMGRKARARVLENFTLEMSTKSLVRELDL